MSKILDNFKKMDLLTKIASIAFLAAFIVIVCSTFIGYIGDIFFSGIFKLMFANVYNFFAITAYFITSVLKMLFIAALVIAIFSGSKKNVGFVLACKAALMLLDMTILTPFLRVFRVIGYGFTVGGVVGWSEIGNGFLSFLNMLAIASLAILVMDGFEELTKIVGIITAGVFGISLIANCVRLVSSLVDCVKFFIAGNVRNGILTLLINSGDYCGAIILVCGYIVLCLAAVFAFKGPIIPKKATAQVQQ